MQKDYIIEIQGDDGYYREEIIEAINFSEAYIKATNLLSKLVSIEKLRITTIEEII